jgi:hypothetical protein
VSLRISTNATRCPYALPGKARFRLGERSVTIEDLVLHRWRQRTQSARRGEIFDGCRLRPNTWRALRLACDAGLSLSEGLSKEELTAAIAVVRAANPTLRMTQPDKLLRVISYLRSRGVLAAIVDRECAVHRRARFRSWADIST